MTDSEVELLRASYRPAVIRVLFVGESAPAGGAFFYKGYGTVYTEFRKALLPLIGEQPTFLDAFRSTGLYVDDLVLTPVDNLPSRERKRLQNDNVISLADRISVYRPQAVVAFLKAIELPVEAAVGRSGLDCAFHVVPFPGNGRQKLFQQEMEAICPSLLKHQ